MLINKCDFCGQTYPRAKNHYVLFQGSDIDIFKSEDAGVYLGTPMRAVDICDDCMKIISNIFMLKVKE